MGGGSKDQGAAGWRKHLDGWQAGLVLLVIAGSAILLAAPRAVEPEIIPPPAVDIARLRQVMREDNARALAAQDRALDVDVRHLGRELRDYNRAAARSEDEDFAAARTRVVRAAAKAIGGAGVEQLLGLRAFQMLRFIQELRRWEKDGTVSKDLEELGGDFLVALQRNEWCRGRELVLDEPTLRAFYKQRWGTITGLKGKELALTPDEDRTRYAFLLRHPFRRNDPGFRDPTPPRIAERQMASQRLLIVDKLAAADPGYPADLARGVILYRTGQWAPSADAFRKHMEAHPDGPYRLRAQNYLKAALDRARLAGF